MTIVSVCWLGANMVRIQSKVFHSTVTFDVVRISKSRFWLRHQLQMFYSSNRWPMMDVWLLTVVLSYKHVQKFPLDNCMFRCKHIECYDNNSSHTVHCEIYLFRVYEMEHWGLMKTGSCTALSKYVGITLRMLSSTMHLAMICHQEGTLNTFENILSTPLHQPWCVPSQTWKVFQIYRSRPVFRKNQIKSLVT